MDVTDDALAVVIDPSIDVVVELIGGIEPARTLMLTALGEGKSVVTANKELLAHHGSELLVAADRKGVDLYFEASVGGAVPVVRALRESLSGDRITKVQGVLNGTANFVLTRMEEDGCSLADALKEAQERGFAEADPSADIEGFDAAAKAAILATVISRQPVTPSEVEVEGIADVTRDEMRSAARRGFAVKLVTSIDLHSRGLSARVGPALVPHQHPLSSARHETNAVVIDAEAAGRLVFVGAGAGGPATASAVLGDIVAVARNALSHARGPAPCNNLSVSQTSRLSTGAV